MARPPTAMSSEDGRGGQDGSEAGALDGGAEGNFSGFWSEPSGPSVSVLALLAGLARAGVDWRDKMGLFQQLGEAAAQAGGHHAGEVAANVERVSAALLDGIGALGRGFAGRGSPVITRMKRCLPSGPWPYQQQANMRTTALRCCVSEAALVLPLAPQATPTSRWPRRRWWPCTPP